MGRKYAFQTDISNPACHIMSQSGEECEKEKTKREMNNARSCGGKVGATYSPEMFGQNELKTYIQNLKKT